MQEFLIICREKRMEELRFNEKIYLTDCARMENINEDQYKKT